MTKPLDRTQEIELVTDLTGISLPQCMAQTTAYEKHVDEWVEKHEKQRAYRAESKNDGTELEIDILDVIGGGWFFEGITARQIKRTLNENPNAKTIRLVIDSPGGVVWDGLAIQALLKRSAATVEVEVIGEASSAASVIAMAGDTVKMHEGAMMMIHRASSAIRGFASDFRAAADFLDKITESIIDLYDARSPLSREDIVNMVEEETWMSAREAVEHGFADELIPAKTTKSKSSKSKREDKNSAEDPPSDKPEGKPIVFQDLPAGEHPEVQQSDAGPKDSTEPTDDASEPVSSQEQEPPSAPAVPNNQRTGLSAFRKTSARPISHYSR